MSDPGTRETTGTRSRTDLSRVILNPNAGQARKDPEWMERLERRSGFELRRTEAPGEAAQLAREAVREGYAEIVAAGGDGTINEVVNGMSADFGRARLGIIPLGTANDLVHSLGIPDDPEEAIEVLDAGASREVDVARVRSSEEHRWFLNVAVGGFGVGVGQALEEERKLRWGELAYFRQALEAFEELEEHHSEIVLDDEELRLRAVTVAIANGRRVGGGVIVAPEARLDDGLLDVVVLTASSLPKLLSTVGKSLIGQPLESEHVLFRRSRRVAIRSVSGMRFNADGEVVGRGSADFDVEPRALRVVVPA